MSTNVKSEDLFGGLSESEGSSGEEEKEEVLQTTKSIDLLQEMAMSCSSDDDDGDAVDGKDDGNADIQEDEIKAESMSTENTQDLTNKKNIASYEAPIVDAKAVSKSAEISEPTPQPALCDQCPNGSQRKRKVGGVSEVPSKEIPKKADDTKISLDGLDALTNLIDSVPKLPKQVKRSSISSEPLPKKIKAIVEQAISKKNLYPVPIMPSSSGSRPVQKFPLQAKSVLPQDARPKQITPIEKTEELKQLEHLVLLGNFSKEQLERYEVYRRSTFNKAEIKRVIERTTGAPAGDQLVIAIRSLAKMLVGELVEEAVELREIRKETDKPIQPHHIKIVFKDLVSQGKLWPPYSSKS